MDLARFALDAGLPTPGDRRIAYLNDVVRGFALPEW
jgi:hypothetical protein